MTKLPMLLLVMLAIATLGQPTQAFADPDECYSDWSLAAPVVKKESLASVEELGRLARIHVPGELLKATLCLDKGHFIYRVVVREPNGTVRNLSIDAKKPFAH